jgi:hypothetical protein
VVLTCDRDLAWARRTQAQLLPRKRPTFAWA